LLLRYTLVTDRASLGPFPLGSSFPPNSPLLSDRIVFFEDLQSLFVFSITAGDWPLRVLQLAPSGRISSPSFLPSLPFELFLGTSSPFLVLLFIRHQTQSMARALLPPFRLNSTLIAPTGFGSPFFYFLLTPPCICLLRLADAAVLQFFAFVRRAALDDSKEQRESPRRGLTLPPFSLPLPPAIPHHAF